MATVLWFHNLSEKWSAPYQSPKKRPAVEKSSTPLQVQLAPDHLVATNQGFLALRHCCGARNSQCLSWHNQSATRAARDNRQHHPWWRADKITRLRVVW